MKQQISLNVKGMHCKACETIIKEGVQGIDGVKKVAVSVLKNKVDVEFDDTKTGEKAIRKSIEDEGYKVV